MNTVYRSQISAKSNRRLVIAWAVFVFAVVGVSWFKALENQRDIRVQTAWQSRISLLAAESNKEFERLKNLLGVTWTTPLTRTELEAKINEGRSFDLQSKGDRLQAHWTHPKYGIPISLSFEDDVLRGFGISGGSPTDLPGNAQPKPHRYDSLAEVYRKTVRSISVFAWLTAMIIVGRKHSWFAAQAMLASAFVYGAATVVSPVYSLTIRGVLSNDPMLWAVLMYVIALVALARTWPATSFKPRFRLSHLLLAMAASSLLMAIGPLGYFTLTVLSAGGLVLVGMLVRRTKILS